MLTPTVNDNNLVRRAFANATNLAGSPRPRWAVIAATFALGSTYASELCRKLGKDPDELIEPGQRSGVEW